MISIKHISPNGSHSISEAKAVTFCPAASKPPEEAVTILKDTVHVFGESSDIEIESGRVYVMNSGGKTIATYHLTELAPGV